jgi:outer membrane protein OmpA-like peptidoglycan-associated protein
MTDVFISYTRKDVEFVRELSADLEKQGLSVWWDQSIPTGKSFDEVIEEALQTAKCVIVVWSKESISSRWVRLEAGEGMSRNLLFPILMEDVQIPLAFRNIQASNLINWNRDLNHPAFKKLVGDIKLGISGINAAESPEAKKVTAASYYPSIDNKPKSSKKQLIIWSSLGLIALLAIVFIVRYVQGNKAIIAETKMWQSTLLADDSLAYVSYMRDYPKGLHIREANARLDSIQNAFKAKTALVEMDSNRLSAYETKVSLAASLIQFETGRDAVSQSSYAGLNEVAEILKNDASQMLTVECHTDNAGRDLLNLALSKGRALSVKRYLTNQGVPESQIQAYGRGSTMPIADNSTAEGRAKNRRTDLKLSQIGQTPN